MEEGCGKPVLGVEFGKAPVRLIMSTPVRVSQQCMDLDRLGFRNHYSLLPRERERESRGGLRL